jgi:hypothetical protein
VLGVLPGGLVDDAGTVHDELALRPLSGREEHLLAGSSASPAALVTAVLSRCVERVGALEVDAAVVRRMLVADRQYALLKLREATFGERVQGSVPCPWPGCGQRVAVGFSTRDVPVTASVEKGPVYAVELSAEAGGGTVSFRLPTGADQETVAELLAAAGEASALGALLEACVLDGGGGSLAPRARMEVEAEMARVAPRVDLDFDATCAECGRAFTAPFDVQSFFFGELQVTSALLAREVHYLAYHYHWSEREIMEMPRDARARYIAVLADEIERMNASA